MKTFFFSALAVGVADASFCSVLGTLPTICTCGEKTLGFELTCNQPAFYGTGTGCPTGTLCVKVIDTTVTAKYTLTPCAAPAGMSLVLSNSAPVVTLTKAIGAGATTSVPLPGAGWTITGVGAGALLAHMFRRAFSRSRA
jgi:hypothetical protein